MLSSPRITVIGAAILLCFCTTLALATPPVRVLPNRITLKYLLMDAQRRTLHEELTGNGQMPVPRFPHSPRRISAKRIIRRPVLLDFRPVRYQAPGGVVNAIEVSVLGSTRVAGAIITSVYSYTYDRLTGALLAMDVSLAPATLARAHNMASSGI